MIQRDPDLRMTNGHGYDLTRAQDREQTMRQIARLVQLKKTLKHNDPMLVQALFQAMSVYSASLSMKIYVHEILFQMAINLFGTAAQQDRWMDDLEEWRVIGCFAMVKGNFHILFVRMKKRREILMHIGEFCRRN